MYVRMNRALVGAATVALVGLGVAGCAANGVAPDVKAQLQDRTAKAPPADMAAVMAAHNGGIPASAQKQ